MKLEGRVWKDGKLWLVEVPLLDLMTQGHSKREALEMVVDAVGSLVAKDGFKAEVVHVQGERMYLGANNTSLLVALLLRRQREAKGLSLADVAERMGQSSRNSFARYETGKTSPTIDKLEELLAAINPGSDFVLGGHAA